MRSPAIALLLVVIFCSAAWGGSDQPSGMPLEGTYWRLTQLGDQTVAPIEGRRQAHLMLRPDQGQAGGSDGCNRFFGGYQLDGDKITFERIMATKMYCVEQMETADGFHTALSQTRSWKVTGGQLELLDAEGKPLAQFEAAENP